MKLLLAEDTRDLNHALVTVLTMQNYDVDAAYDGEEALSFIRRNGYDGIILDIMMPKKSGLEVLREMRAQNITTPVLLLTAKSEVDDRVQGLDDGADDYLTKPFAMKELLARVRSLVRRGREYHAKELHCGDLTLNAESLELTAENTVRLSMKEFELMQLLVQNEGKELSTSYLLEHVWSDEPDAGNDTVWLYINFLKGKLGSIASSAITREGRHLAFIKYIPLSIGAQLNVKALISIIISGSGMLIYVIAAGIYLHLGVKLVLLCCVISLLSVVFTSYFGIYMDSVNPKLIWDSELNALRGNYNIFFNMAIAILLEAVVCAGAYLAFKFTPIGSLLIILLLLILLMVLTAVSYLLCSTKAVKNIDRLSI